MINNVCAITSDYCMDNMEELEEGLLPHILQEEEEATVETI
jgi:hypothetical protein